MDYTEEIIKLRILSFYGWWELTTCLFASLALLAIWYHIGKKQKDFGQVWLAISVLCWSISGIVEIYFSQVLSEFITYAADASPEVINRIELKWNGWRSLLSLLNSFFILLALPWFRYIPEKIHGLISSKYWLLIVGLPFVFCFLPTLTQMFTGKSAGLISELDVYYSVLTLIFLAITVWSSFAKRRFPLLAVLSLVCVFIAFAAQLLKLFNTDINEVLFSAIFKTNLIMIFFALALSWVKELSENVHKDAVKWNMKLSKNMIDQDRVERLVNLKIGSKNYEVQLSETHFNLMESFVNRRTEQDQEGGWLEIKPKNDNRSGKTYDIQDYNQLKRLTQAMLDGMYGKGNWSQDVHGQSFKDMIFEKSEKHPRMIRIKQS